MRPVSALTLCLALVVVAAAACDSKPTAPAEPSPTVAETPAVDKPVAPPKDAAAPKEAGAGDKAGAPKAEFPAHMKDHFSQAVTLRDLLIVGDLEGARKPAEWLADRDKHGEFPEAWNPHTTKMHISAKRIATAKSLEEASKEFGQLGNTCAECHVALGAKPGFAETPMPSGAADTRAHMQRHAWGVARLWEGLIGPSEDRWSLGAVLLAEEPLHEDKFLSGEPVSDKARLLSASVHKLGQQASEPTDGAARTRIYGELLATCSGCHSEMWPQLGRKMEPPVVEVPAAAGTPEPGKAAGDDAAPEDDK